MPFMSVLSAIFKSPFAKWVILIAITVAILAGTYHAGSVSVQTKWDAANEKIRADELAKETVSTAATTNTDVKYVDRVKVITEKGAIVVKYVDRYITQEDNKKCILTMGFVRLHDGDVVESPSKE